LSKGSMKRGEGQKSPWQEGNGKGKEEEGGGKIDCTPNVSVEEKGRNEKKNGGFWVRRRRKKERGTRG